jgi:hypothetical protein
MRLAQHYQITLRIVWLSCWILVVATGNTEILRAAFGRSVILLGFGSVLPVGCIVYSSREGVGSHWLKGPPEQLSETRSGLFFGRPWVWFWVFCAASPMLLYPPTGVALALFAFGLFWLFDATSGKPEGAGVIPISRILAHAQIALGLLLIVGFFLPMSLDHIDPLGLGVDPIIVFCFFSPFLLSVCLSQTSAPWPRAAISATVIPLLFGAWFLGLLSGGVDSASAYTEPLIGGHIVEHSIYVLGALCVAQGVVSIFAQLRVKSGT